MSTSQEQDWDTLAVENLSAADTLVESGKWRSAISRSWYSSMASCHAMLIRFQMTPPAQGNWPNPAIPALIWNHFKNAASNATRADALRLREKLQRCWTFRLIADYAPASAVDRGMAFEARRTARELRKRLEMLR